MRSSFQLVPSLASEAIRALSSNKLRSALAALGITIGIAAVVCVVAIGRASSVRLEEQLQSLGDNLIWVEAGSRNVSGVRTGTHGMNNLTLDDAKAILDEIRLIKSVSPHVDSHVSVVHENHNWTTTYRGVGPEYIDIKRWRIAEGNWFTQAEVDRVANVCVIGQTVREQLFGSTDPIGRVIRISNQLFEVIGLLAPKGQTAHGFDQDDIMLSALSPQAVNRAIEEIVALMRQRHHIRPGEEDDFNVRRPEEVIKAQLETRRTLSIFLISIASISLLVGGIGILNVMLVSVTQRTREIGLRLAVGATERAIQAQFLGEAVILSLFGGLFGISFGVISSVSFCRVLEWPMSIPSQALIIAPAFSIAVGIFFGFYPARRAARMDPISALRYE